MSSNGSGMTEPIAKELSLKFGGKTVPAPKHLSIIENESSVWNKSPHRFKQLIASYCHLYNEMTLNIQNQQKTLQVFVKKTLGNQSKLSFDI